MEETPASTTSDVFLALAIGLAATAFAAYARHISLARPGVTTHLGFYRGFDQGSYLRTARILARWHLPARYFDYEYGLGYPILGAPFIWLGMRADPFAVVDAVAFGASVSLTFVLGLRVTALRSRVRPELIAIGAALVLAVSSPLLTLASSPWNSNVVVPQRRRLLLFGGSAFLLVLTLVLLSQQYTFGSFLTTPYHFHHRTSGAVARNDQSLGEYRISAIPKHFVGTFITGKQNGVREPGDPILRQFPLLLLAPIGAWSLLRARARRRSVWLGAIAGSLIGSLFYLSFVAGGAGDLAFGNARYWAPWYPLWALCSVLGLAVSLSWLSKLAAPWQRSHVTSE